MDRRTFKEIARNTRLPHRYRRQEPNDVDDIPVMTVERRIGRIKVSLTIELRDGYPVFGFNINNDIGGIRTPEISMLYVAHKEIAVAIDGAAYRRDKSDDNGRFIESVANDFCHIINFIYKALWKRLLYWIKVFEKLQLLMKRELRQNTVNTYKCAFYDIACRVPSAILKGRENLALNETETWRTINVNHGGAVQASFNYFLRICYLCGVEDEVRSNLNSCREKLQSLNVDPFFWVGARGR